MSELSYSSLRYLDQAVSDPADLFSIKKVIDFILKSGKAVDEGMNLASILSDQKNLEFLNNNFGGNITTVLQMITRVILSDSEKRSFTTYKDIFDTGKIEFIYKSVGGWKQFETTIELFHPGEDRYVLVDPTNYNHWNRLGEIHKDTIICIYMESKDDGDNDKQIKLALDRYEAIFDTIQNVDKSVMNVTSNRSSSMANTQGLESGQGALKTKQKVSKSPKAKKRSSQAPKWSLKKKGGTMTSANMIKALRFMINKQDTFIHAGNAQLIISHLRSFDGVVKFYVIRGEKEIVNLDADSIWTKEIRNGEEVLYEFFGDTEPDDGFLKDLIMKTNKYTQADKY